MHIDEVLNLLMSFDVKKFCDKIKYFPSALHCTPLDVKQLAVLRTIRNLLHTVINCNQIRFHRFFLGIILSCLIVETRINNLNCYRLVSACVSIITICFGAIHLGAKIHQCLMLCYKKKKTSKELPFYWHSKSWMQRYQCLLTRYFGTLLLGISNIAQIRLWFSVDLHRL